ncbi:MAG: disulfide bond formation protein B [Cellvibrionaceae bacterium]|nr:disulfide bond formation protein B [Cellvibrionaceae bacterium]
MLNTFPPSVRATNLLIALGCCTAMLVAVLYFQKTLELEPCPLCISQRIFVIAIAVVAFVAFLHNPGRKGQVIYGSSGLLAALIGAGIAARHTWLQSLPEELVPACGPGLSYMFDALPLFDALRLLFQGDGNCADVQWSLLGLSIPGWTLVAFIGFAAMNVYQIFRGHTR